MEPMMTTPSLGPPTVAVVGSRGYMGNLLMQTFLQALKQVKLKELRVLTSVHAANADELIQDYLGKGANIVPVNYEDSSGVTLALQGVDVVVSALGTRGSNLDHVRKILLDAIEAAEIKLYFLSEFGVDHYHLNSPLYTEHFSFKGKREHFLECKRRSINAIRMFIGSIMEYTFKKQFGLNCNSRLWSVIGDAADIPCALTAEQDIGQFTLEALLLAYNDLAAGSKVPSEFYVYSDMKTLREYADMFDAFTGKSTKIESFPLKLFQEEWEKNLTVDNLTMRLFAEGIYDYSVLTSNFLLNPNESKWKLKKINDYVQETEGAPWRMNPFIDLPIYCWETVFESLSDPRDKLSLMRADPILKNAFEFKTEEWTFWAALPIILTTISQDHRYYRDIRTISLNCRLLSRTHCRVVDKLLQIYWNNNHSLPPTFHSRDFEFPEDITEFIEYFENHPPRRMPFISRYIRLIYRDTETLSDEDIKKLFAAVGNDVKGLSVLYLLAEDPMDLLVLSTMETVPALLPKMKFLEIYLVADNIDDAVMIKALSHKLPKIPHLEELTVNGCPDTLRLLKNAFNLANNFPHLTTLCLGFALWKEEYNVGGLFPKLEFLSFVFVRLFEEENKAERLLLSLDAPKLKCLTMYTEGSNQKSVEENGDKHPQFAHRRGLRALRERYPECKCTCNITYFYQGVNANLEFFIERPSAS